jgi:hypothetical protein
MESRKISFLVRSQYCPPLFFLIQEIFAHGSLLFFTYFIFTSGAPEHECSHFSQRLPCRPLNQSKWFSLGTVELESRGEMSVVSTATNT